MHALKGNMNHSDDNLSKKVPAIAWLIWGLAAFFYFAQYLLRIVPSVIQEDLFISFQSLATNPTLWGQLGGFFYLPYIIMQIPIGGLVDRFGAKLLLGLAAFACALSAYWFGETHSLFGLFGSRFLLGLFSAAGFVCALKLARIWFPPYLFGLIIGITQALGMSGPGLSGPIATINTHFGYSVVFQALAIVFVILSIMSFIYVRNAPNHNTPSKENAHSAPKITKALMLKVMTSKYTWINAFYAGLIYGPVQVLGEFWGPFFFSNIYNISPTEAAWAVTMMFIGLIIGSPAAGVLSDRLGRKRVMILSAIMTNAILAFIFLGPSLPPLALFVLCFLFGILSTGLVASYAASGELHDKASAGLSMAIANMFSIGIGAILMPICGYLLNQMASGALDASGNPIYTHYEILMSFSLLPICGLGALILSIMMKETYHVKDN